MKTPRLLVRVVLLPVVAASLLLTGCCQTSCPAPQPKPAVDPKDANMVGSPGPHPHAR